MGYIDNLKKETAQGVDEIKSDVFKEIKKNISIPDQKKKIPVLCMFLDLSKAFDTVTHKLILENLYNHGIR